MSAEGTLVFKWRHPSHRRTGVSLVSGSSVSASHVFVCATIDILGNIVTFSIQCYIWSIFISITIFNLKQTDEMMPS